MDGWMLMMMLLLLLLALFLQRLLLPISSSCVHELCVIEASWNEGVEQKQEGKTANVSGNEQEMMIVRSQAKKKSENQEMEVEVKGKASWNATTRLYV